MPPRRHDLVSKVPLHSLDTLRIDTTRVGEAPNTFIMAHFYFHVRQDKVLFEDRRGGEFSDLRAAWVWAESDARAMIREGQMRGNPDHWWMEICDVTGKIVASLPFVRIKH